MEVMIMIKTLLKVRELKNTYQANSLIYYLMRFPLIGKLFPSTLYANQAIKILMSVVAFIFGFFKMLIGKIIYIVILSTVATFLSSVDIVNLTQGQVFLNLLVFCTLGGGIGNCFILDPKKEQEYAIIYMRMSAKKVVLSGYIQFILSSLIGFSLIYFVFPMLNIPFIGPFLQILKAPEFNTISILSIFAILVGGKTIGAAIILALVARKNKLKSIVRTVISVSISAILAGFGVVLSYSNFEFTLNILMIAGSSLLVIGAFAFTYLINFKKYNKLYKNLLVMLQQAVSDASLAKRQAKVASGYIQEGGKIDSEKTGYAFLSECFAKRHRKIMLNATKIFIIVEVVLVSVIVGACLFVPAIGKEINGVVVSVLPLLTYLLCFTNCGERTVKAYFMNCDNELLTYRFYRQPKSIIAMFTLRLKSMITLDWVQSLPLALGLPLILFVSGGTQDITQYIMLFVSVMAMSSFFSINNLVIYYVFQPYNKEVEMKNPVYSLLRGLTYGACYVLMQVNPPFEIYGFLLIGFCVVYILISLPIAYKVAPKTFKLR